MGRLERLIPSHRANLLGRGAEDVAPYEITPSCCHAKFAARECDEQRARGRNEKFNQTLCAMSDSGGTLPPSPREVAREA